MPNPPSGILIYKTRNMFAVPLPPEDLLDAFGMMNPQEFAKLPEADRNRLRGLIIAKAGDFQRRMVTESLGACNAMVFTFIGRVFHRENSIEDAWLSPDEEAQFVTRHRSYFKNLLREALADLDKSRPGSTTDSRNFDATNQAISQHGLGYRLMMTLQREVDRASIASHLALVASQVKLHKFCLFAFHFRLTGGGQAGHAIGFISQGGVWYLLEPNYGLYRYGSQKDFENDMARLLGEYGMNKYMLLRAAPAEAGEKPDATSVQLLDVLEKLLPVRIRSEYEEAISAYSIESASRALLTAMDKGMPSTSKSTRKLDKMDSAFERPAASSAGARLGALDDRFQPDSARSGSLLALLDQAFGTR